MPFQKGHGFIGGGSEKGVHNSPQTEFKKDLVPWNKGIKGLQVAWNKGIKLSQEHIQHLKGKRPRSSGENNHRWNGGVSTANEKIRGSLEYKLWQDSVKNRDGNCCVKCGEKRISKIMAHHILNFSNHIEIRLAIDNGVTFCRVCHKEFHLRYGIRNNNREQLLEFCSAEKML